MLRPLNQAGKVMTEGKLMAFRYWIRFGTLEFPNENAMKVGPFDDCGNAEKALINLCSNPDLAFAEIVTIPYEV